MRLRIVGMRIRAEVGEVVSRFGPGSRAAALAKYLGDSTYGNG